MDQFIKLLSDGKSVTCLDDLLSLKVSELKKILFSCNEKVSGNKADLVLRTYANSDGISLSILALEGKGNNNWNS